MKSIIILTDGAADRKIEKLGYRTPLEVAKKPVIDSMASEGKMGMVKTVPEGMSPGSDIANLSVLGYDPKKYYTGRSSLEAVSIGVDLAQDDITFRCNLVTLSDEKDYEQKTMVDYSSGEITTPESRELIDVLSGKLSEEDIRFYAGVSYRHVIVWKKGPFGAVLTPPHDILDKKIAGYLPRGEGSAKILEMMQKSAEILRGQPVNAKRSGKGLNTADSIWLWGQGKKPLLDNFQKRYGVSGAVISAVDLVKGIGICAGLDPVKVEGATGNINTNFKGKADAALKVLLDDDKDFVFLHIEAPDECGHQGKVEDKVRSIELIDSQVVKVIKEGLEASGKEFRIMVLPDHPTPIEVRTHTSDPVPYLIYYYSDSKADRGKIIFSEKNASRTGNYFDAGYKLTGHFLSK